jgi:hypothetical protein
MFRWTARFLLLVMVAPAFGPMAMASIAWPETTHCARQSMAMAVPAAQPEMPCHHARAQTQSSSAAATPTESSEAAFRAVDDCCQGHGCCRCATTAGWAQPVSGLLSFSHVPVEASRSAPGALLHSSDISGQDSARAPPLT